MIWTWSPLPPAREETRGIHLIQSFRRAFDGQITGSARRLTAYCKIYRPSSPSRVTSPTGERIDGPSNYTLSAEWPYLAWMQHDESPVLVKAVELDAFIRFCGYSADYAGEIAGMLGDSMRRPHYVPGAAVPSAPRRSPIVKLIDMADLGGVFAHEGVGLVLAGDVGVMADESIVETATHFRVFPSSLDRFLGELADGTRFVVQARIVRHWLEAGGQNIPFDLDQALARTTADQF